MSIEDRSCHSQESVRNTNAFLDCAFSAGSSAAKTGVACPCSDCRNRVGWRRHVMKRSRASVMAARRQCQQEDERLRKEAHDANLAKEYVQNMMESGRIVQAWNENIQRFMESVGLHTGMPGICVPSPLPPPPPPPGSAVSPSPNPSHESAGTLGSSVGKKTLEQTPSRITGGNFRSHVSATNSGGGSYSAPQGDECPLFSQ